MSKPETGLTVCRLRAVNVLAGAESNGADVPECDSETLAECLRNDPEFVAALNRVKLAQRERLRAEVRSLASDAMATYRELISGPRHVPHSVRLRACLALLHAADALNAEEIGPTSAEGAQAKLQHDRFLESLGG